MDLRSGVAAHGLCVVRPGVLGGRGLGDPETEPQRSLGRVIVPAGLGGPATRLPGARRAGTAPLANAHDLRPPRDPRGLPSTPVPGLAAASLLDPGPRRRGRDRPARPTIRPRA